MNTILLKEVKSFLQEVSGDRLKGAVLYDSDARGEANPDSDIDILVLLEGPIHIWRDLRTNIQALYLLSLKYGRPISPKPVDIKQYKAAKYPLYINARREGALS
jgi:uncharacterized protein